MIEIAILGLMFLSVLLFVVIEIFFGLRESLCKSLKLKNKHLKPVLFYSILNKVMPLQESANNLSIDRSPKSTNDIQKKSNKKVKPNFRAKYKLK